MIKAIQFKNYKSFKGEQNLIFDANKNVYLVYGKNSSGKTNLYNLFKDISNIVNKYNFFNESEFKDNINIFSKKDKDTVFKLNLLFENNNEEYAYSIDVDYIEGIIKESLQTEKEIIFSCEKEEIKSSYLSESLIERIRTFNLKETSILAILFNENISSESIKGYDFKSLKPVFEYIFKAQNLFEKKYLLNENFMDKYKEMLFDEIKSIDVGIDDFRIVDLSEITLKIEEHLLTKLKEDGIGEDEEKIKLVKEYARDIAQPIKLYSKKQGVELDYEKESRGTKLYIDYIATFMFESYVNKRKIFIFDELDAGLSNALLKRLILFFEKNFKESQLIFSTHNTNLLDANEELNLSKENYIIVDKKEYDSEVYRLNSFVGLRNDNRNNFEKMYLNGRFGGIHEFD